MDFLVNPLPLYDNFFYVTEFQTFAADKLNIAVMTTSL